LGDWDLGIGNLYVIITTGGDMKKRGQKEKYWRLSDGKRVTAKDVALATGMSLTHARRRLRRYTHPEEVFHEISSRPIPKISKLRIIMSRPAYDPMFILAMKKI